jgi:hypothetical protein
MTDRFLFVSDLQLPFTADKALEFCVAVQKEFKIPSENCYCVGDEVDQYFGSQFKKDPDAAHTAMGEIKATKDELKRWYKAFPLMKVAISNHGLRWAKKAFEAEIPSQMLRPYQDLIEAPDGWKWKERWMIKGAKAPILMIHGMGYGGQSGARNAAIDSGVNTVIGHLHSHAGVSYINTAGRKIWGLNTGCLIDVEAYAFNYGKDMRHKPVLGCGVVLDGGLTPIFVPYERHL